MTFFANYSINNKPVIVRSIPNFSSNPDGINYGLYCKNQLLKLKPWKICHKNAWDNQPEYDVTFVMKWRDLLTSELGQKTVPQWQRHLSDAMNYFNEDNERDCDNENVASVNEEHEDWMYVARMTPLPETTVFSLHQIEQMKATYSMTQIQEMPFWLDNIKASAVTDVTHINLVNIALLNRKQSIAYEIVRQHYESNQTEPIRLIITGQGGSGKSFIINALKSLLRLSCVLCSFFGIASHNIEGVTLHSLLQLPIRGLFQCDLTGKALVKLQQKLRDKFYIIIDEFSVIGQKMLGWIDRRLRQASGALDETFGGFSVIIVGDIAQLPPVSDKPLYHSIPDDSTSLMGYCAYHEIKNVVQLDKNQRVMDTSQEKFRNVLLRLRNGTSTIEDWQLLTTRSSANVDAIYFENMPLRLAFSNKIVAEHNYNLLKESREPIYPIKAKHNSIKAAKLSPDNFGGLEALIHLAVNAHVMLTRNLWVEKGLCNGSMGTVKQIIYKDHQGPPALPVAVMVKFDKYRGPTFCNSDLLPIVPVLSCIEDNQERQQIPLKLSWAITIHKSQGLTIDKVFVDLGATEKVAGLAYVALSRVRTLSDLIIEPFSYERLTTVKKVANFSYRIQEEERLADLDKLTCEQYAS